MSAMQRERLESIVVRGLQAGIASCRVSGDLLPDLIAMLHARHSADPGHQHHQIGG